MKELRDEKTYRALLMLFAVLLLRYFRNAWFESESVCYSLSFYEFFFFKTRGINNTYLITKKH